MERRMKKSKETVERLSQIYASQTTVQPFRFGCRVLIYTTRSSIRSMFLSNKKTAKKILVKKGLTPPLLFVIPAKTLIQLVSKPSGVKRSRLSQKMTNDKFPKKVADKSV